MSHRPFRETRIGKYCIRTHYASGSFTVHKRVFLFFHKQVGRKSYPTFNSARKAARSFIKNDKRWTL